MDSCLSVWLLLIFISFHCINGYYYSESLNLLTMKPSHDKEVAVNDFIQLSCNTDSARKLSISLNGIKVKKAAKASSIDYQLTSNKPKTFNFSCNYFSNPVKITFRYFPQVTSFKPVITGSENILHVKLNFTVEHFQKLDYIRIRRYVRKTKSYENCNLTMCEFNSYLYVEHHFEIDLTGSTQNSTFVTNLTYYKLDKLQGSISKTHSENLSLSYDIKNMYDNIIAKDCLYRIFYKSEWEQTSKNFTINETSIVLKNLVPYTTYTIDIQAKLVSSIYWSDKLTFQRRTFPSAPYSGPNSTNGSYFETPCSEESKRCFILYWAMIPIQLRNGIFDSFVIQQDNKFLLQTSEIFAKIKDQPKNKDLWFEIRAKNKNSQLSPPTVIHIPPKAPTRPRGISVVQLNSTHFNISWTLKQPLRNVTVTVMSCLGKKASSTLWCKSNVMFTKIKDRNFLILKAVNTSNFAASVSTSFGSSSLILAECILSQGIARKPKKPLIGERQPYQVNLRLPNFDCEDLIGRPTVFQILYAEGNNCENGSQMNIPAIGIKPETEFVEIKGMKPFTNYSFCLRVRTEEGWSTNSPQIKTTTAETNPIGVRNLTVINTTAQSVTLKWDPTLQPNGIITSHRIEYNKLGGKTGTVFSNVSNMATISKLVASSKYNFSVSTCNKAGCSEKSFYVTATTLTGGYEISELIIMIIIPIIVLIFPLIYCIKKISQCCQETNIEIKFPEIDPEVSSHQYETIDSDSQTELICQTSADFRSIKKEQYTLKFDDDDDNKSKTSSMESVEMADFNQKELSSKVKKMPCSKEHFNINEHKCNDINTSNHHGNKCSVFCTTFTTNNMDHNGYIKDNNLDESNMADLSQLKQHHLNSKGYVHHERNLSELNQVNMDSNGYLKNIVNSSDSRQVNSNGHVQDDMKSSEWSQANFDSNGYLKNIMNTSNLGQVNSDSNAHLQDIVKSSELSQVDSDSNGYIKNIMNSSESSQANSDSNGYVQNIINSSKSSQANSDSNSYVQNIINSSESSQANSDSNGYVQNIMNSSESSQANSDFNGYITNITNSSESSQANSDSNSYVQNIINSSKSSQANSDSNGYVQNIISSSESSQANSDSNGYVQNIINSSKSSQANSDSNSYVQNIINSSKSSQANSDSNGYVQNIISSSESSQANSDSNGYVQNIINSSKSSQANSDSNSYVQNIINSSESSQTNSDSNGYVQNIMNSSESSQANSDFNGYITNITNSSKSSQANSDSNGYVQNIISSSESSQANSDSNGYVQNIISSSESSQANSDSNGYVQNIINSSELSQANSKGYIKNIINLSELSQANSDSNGYVQNIINSSELSYPISHVKNNNKMFQNV